MEFEQALEIARTLLRSGRYFKFEEIYQLADKNMAKNELPLLRHNISLAIDYYVAVKTAKVIGIADLVKKEKTFIFLKKKFGISSEKKWTRILALAVKIKDAMDFIECIFPEGNFSPHRVAEAAANDLEMDQVLIFLAADEISLDRKYNKNKKNMIVFSKLKAIISQTNDTALANKPKKNKIIAFPLTEKNNN